MPYSIPGPGPVGGYAPPLGGVYIEIGGGAGTAYSNPNKIFPPKKARIHCIYAEKCIKVC